LTGQRLRIAARVSLVKDERDMIRPERQCARVFGGALMATRLGPSSSGGPKNRRPWIIVVGRTLLGRAYPTRGLSPRTRFSRSYFKTRILRDLSTYSVFLSTYPDLSLFRLFSVFSYYDVLSEHFPARANQQGRISIGQGGVSWRNRRIHKRTADYIENHSRHPHKIAKNKITFMGKMGIHDPRWLRWIQLVPGGEGSCSFGRPGAGAAASRGSKSRPALAYRSRSGRLGAASSRFFKFLQVSHGAAPLPPPPARAGQRGHPGPR